MTMAKRRRASSLDLSRQLTAFSNTLALWHVPLTRDHALRFMNDAFLLCRLDPEQGQIILTGPCSKHIRDADLRHLLAKTALEHCKAKQADIALLYLIGLYRAYPDQVCPKDKQQMNRAPLVTSFQKAFTSFLNDLAEIRGPAKAANWANCCAETIPSDTPLHQNLLQAAQRYVDCVPA